MRVHLLLTGPLLFALGSGTLTQQSVQNETPTQTPSEVARFLAEHGSAVEVPGKGKVKQQIKKDAPTFATPMGPTTAVLLRLPEYQAPYSITITSFRRGIGRTTEVFVPNGTYFDAEFHPLKQFGEDRVEGREGSLAVELLFGEATSAARYLLLYTRGDLIHQRIGMRASVYGAPVEGKLGTWLGSGFGLARLERSLEGNIQVETSPPKESEIARKLGGPWKQIEGATEARVRQLLGPPSLTKNQRDVTTLYYDGTQAGTVHVYIVDGVATLKRLR